MCSHLRAPSAGRQSAATRSPATSQDRRACSPICESRHLNHHSPTCTPRRSVSYEKLRLSVCEVMYRAENGFPRHRQAAARSTATTNLMHFRRHTEHSRWKDNPLFSRGNEANSEEVSGKIFFWTSYKWPFLPPCPCDQ